MRILIELLKKELESSEPILLDATEILSLHNSIVTLFLKNRNLRNELERNISELAKLLSFIRLSKFLNRFIPKDGVDKGIALALDRLREYYSQLLSGKIPITQDMRIPVKVTSKVNEYGRIFGVNEGDVCLLPLTLALILASLGIAVIVK